MSHLPRGTVTFLFTDIEGSTRLLQDLSDRYAQVLADYRQLLRTASQKGNGHEVDTQGDATFIAFPRAKDALVAAVTAQRSTLNHQWPNNVSVRVRMGLHTGEPLSAETGYVGMDVHRAARICAAGHGGQILLSQTTRDLVADELPEGMSLQDLGGHRLKDLASPQHLFQVVVADLPADFPSIKALDALPNNLPIQLTSFIGRERERAEVKRLLATTRLLTLAGAGGCGKTRLALQVAAEMLEQFADGVWVVELAPLSDPSLVSQTVASALAVREQPGRPILATLSDSLQNKHLLLVVDNCEHMVAASAQLVDSMLRSCPNLQILATSRERLGIAGETTWSVPSLSSPDPWHLPPAETLVEYEAVRLFVERAVAALPTFTLTHHNAHVVAQVCNQLDGIPLAIELAAARVRLMGPDEVLKRLEDRFRLLTGGSRTALPRQQTLQAAVDWSYDLLTEPERVPFRRLAVFAGGFDLQAAEEVCRGEALAGDDVVELLSQLVDKSLVIADAAEDGSVRYRLLETLRQYGREKLCASGEEEAVLDNHLRYYLALAEKSYAGKIDAAPEWLGRLEREHDNLRAALEWTRGRHPKEQLQLAGALAWFWHFHSHLTEGRERVAEALAGRQGRSPAMARALWGAGMLAAWQGDAAHARSAAEESLAMWRELGDHMEVALALEALGYAHFFKGDDADAMSCFEECLQIQRGLGNPRLINRAVLNVCLILISQGDVDKAEPLAEQALAVALGYREPRDIHSAHHYLGDCALIRGDVLRSEGRYAESLKAALAYGDEMEASYEIQGVAMSAAGQSRAVKALRLGGAAASKLQSLGAASVRFWDELLAKYLGRAREELGGEAATAAWEEGKRMGFERAVEYALNLEQD